MLLSLVVIFTQSIQLSKIVERLALLRCAIAPWGGLSIKLKVQPPPKQPEAQPQAALLAYCVRYLLREWWS
jgi:hypothetical protein